MDHRVETLYRWIEECEEEGKALTQMGDTNSIIVRLEEQNAPEVLRNLEQSTLNTYCQILQRNGRIAKYNLSGQGRRVWLGVEGGSLSRGEYMPTTARDNA